MEEKLLKKSTRWAYALGNNGFFIAMTLYTIYPMIFMTKCLNLSISLAVSILSIAKLIDVILSFMVGPFLEKVNLRWGKYRSWFLISPIVAGIAACLFFSPLLLHVPASVVPALSVFLLVLWNTAGNVVQTCHSSMNTVLVNNQLERVRMFKLSNQLQSVTGFIAGFFMMKIVFAVGGVHTINLVGMQAVAIIFSLVYFIFYFIFFLELKDYKDDISSKVKKVKIYDTIKLIFTNGKIAALTVSGILANGSQSLFRGTVSYFFLYTLFSPQQLDTFNWAYVVAMFIGATLAMPIAKRFSKKSTYIFGFCITAVSFAAAYFTTNISYLSLIFICVGHMGLNIARSVYLPMYSDVVDHIKSETGENVVSVAMNAFNLNFKVSGFVGAVATALIASVGFKTGVDPTPQVSDGISLVVLFIPAVIALVGALNMLVFYKLDEKKLKEVQAKMKGRGEVSQKSAAT